MDGVLLSGPTSSVLPSGDVRPKNIKQAATQFEALLVAQMLKEMRASSGAGWMGTGEEDQSSSCILDLADEHLSQTLASQGGLGLARMVIAGVEKRTGAGIAAGESPAVPADAQPSHRPRPGE